MFNLFSLIFPFSYFCSKTILEHPQIRMLLHCAIFQVKLFEFVNIDTFPTIKQKISLHP